MKIIKTLRTSLFLMFFLFLLPGVLLAENLGVYGQIYSIAEPDLLSSIHEKLLTYQNNGKLAEMENNLKDRAQKSILRPTPVADIVDISNGDKPIVSYYTPNLVLPHDIMDQNGKMLYPKGTSINPLDPSTTSKVSPNTYVPQFNETLFFINADNSTQISFAKNAIKTLLAQRPYAIYKIILTNGNLNEASNNLGRIYFDQHGVLSHLFGIHRVPAIVTRSGIRLKITEPRL